MATCNVAPESSSCYRHPADQWQRSNLWTRLGPACTGHCDWLYVRRQKFPVWLHPLLRKGDSIAQKRCDWSAVGALSGPVCRLSYSQQVWLFAAVIVLRTAAEESKERKVSVCPYKRWKWLHSRLLIVHCADRGLSRNNRCGLWKEANFVPDWWTSSASCVLCSCAPLWCTASQP